jgi:GAF domain-containing protein
VLMDAAGLLIAERHLQLLHEVAQLLADSPRPEGIGRELLRTIGEGLGWALGVLWEVDEPAAVLRCTHTWQPFKRQPTEYELVSRSMTLRSGVGAPGQVYATGRPAWIADLTHERGFVRGPHAAKEGLHAALAFPIRAGTRVLSVAEFLSHNFQAPDQGLLRLLSSLGSQVGLFMECKRVEEALRQSEARKEAMLQASLDAIMTMDHNGLIMAHPTNACFVS